VRRSLAAWLLALGAAAVVTAWGISPLGDREPEASIAMHAPSLPPRAPHGVGALGRIEPKDGVIRVAGPARPSAVVAQLLVEDGDRVTAGTPLAVLDGQAADAAVVARAEAELADARAALGRLAPLLRQKVMAPARYDDAKRRVAIAEADLALARANLALDTVRAPVDGRVLVVHARPGERIGPEGLLELGRTDAMYAVAEVYETDIAAVRPGQTAIVRSPAFTKPLSGHVERVGLTVRGQAVLAPDPAADTDARVVEVHVRLDDGARAAALSNLEVDVVIDTEAP
jgi:HlyD family secretion protein